MGFPPLVFEESGLVSLKWQQVSGTAEQKVPFEMMCLAEAVLSGEYDKAYIVLGGPGWSLREYYIGGEMTRYFHARYTDLVEIVDLETFVARANRGEL